MGSCREPRRKERGSCHEGGERKGACVSPSYDAAGSTITRHANTFTYDAAGNRTLLLDGANRTTYTYDAANQLTTTLFGATRTTYTYDAKGNLTVEDVMGTKTTNTWDEENRLIQVAKTGATTNTYTFNGDGQRVQIVDLQGTKKPIWDLSNVLLEQDSLNATQVVYTLEPAIYGNLLSQRRGVTTSYYLFDALGSTRMLTSSAGSSTDTYNFKAFGDHWSFSGSTTNVFRWVGKLGYYYDIDRLAYYLRARPYSPKLARFLSYDPIGVTGGLNLFGYVNNRVIFIVDPRGKFPFDKEREEGEKRRGKGPWDDSAQHCWVACYIGALHGLGNFAAIAGDVGEAIGPSTDSDRDIDAQHYGGWRGNAFNWAYLFGCNKRSPEQFCDDVCEINSKKPPYPESHPFHPEAPLAGPPGAM